MDGATTSNCSIPEPCYSQMMCPTNFTTTFYRSIRNQIWQVDTLLITEAVLAVIIVAVLGAYGEHYRHHRFTRFIFLGATTLFLPIVSSVVSNIPNTSIPNYVKIFDSSSYDSDLFGLSALVAQCDASDRSVFLVIWALLVQIIMVNTRTVVATEDREGQNKGPPIDLIIQGVWTIYLGFSFEGHSFVVYGEYFHLFVYLITPFVLLCAKIVLQYYAFDKARQSFALGRNPGLTFVYMENQRSEPPVGSDPPPPPPLLVMREDEKQVVIQSHGYSFKDDSGTGVTFDRIWHLDSSTHPVLTPQLKGFCLSFALFKLLRCRFARYKLSNAGPMGTWTLKFVKSLCLQSREHDRIFKVIAQELSFVHDYYYSSLPISYGKSCLPILSILLSLLTISYCIYLAVGSGDALQYLAWDNQQLDCSIWWIQNRLVSNCTDYSTGRSFVDLMLLLLLALLVLIAEVRDTVSYICCNWTKVSLVCRYVISHTCSHHSLCMPQWVINLLLRCRYKLIMKEHWNEEISQCSVLVLHHRTALPYFVRRLLPLPDQKWKVKVTAAVKGSIINALGSVINGGLSKGVSSLRRSQVGESFLSACDGKSSSETVLIWHIATCIVQVRNHSGEASNNKTVATHLSQYCAYLVSWCPELLPDNSAWSTSLYKAVKKDAKGALAGYFVTADQAESSTVADHAVAAEAESSTAADHAVADQSSTREDGYQKLIRLLSKNSNHEVLKDAVKLGKQLVAIEDQEIMWKLLAEFWSEMILYLAPSDNLKGHSDAIGRGGELITLLWALLFHAGIESRPGEDDGTVATSAGVV